MNFNESVDIILQLEGGSKITEHPDDPGGLTKYGIALTQHPELGEQGIRNLTREQAAAIYRKSYWDALSLDSVPSYLRLPIFDTAVNMGRQASARLVQSSLIKIGRKVAEDGIVGAKTLMALKGVSGMEFAVEFLFQRIESYRRMKKFKVFGKGWIKRVLRVALTMR
jgi:lysozyme family protein